MARDVLRHQRRAQFLRVERRDLLVERADPRALLVVEHRRRDRARHVVFGKFGRGAHVDDRVECGERFGGNGDQGFGRGFHSAILRPGEPAHDLPPAGFGRSARGLEHFGQLLSLRAAQSRFELFAFVGQAHLLEPPVVTGYTH